MSVRELTEANWDVEVLASPLPVLVDIWAPWCVPCRRVTPMVEELASEFGDRLVVGALNGDDAPRILSRHEVLSLPTLLVFVDGEPLGRIVGVPKMDKLRGLVETFVESN